VGTRRRDEGGQPFQKIDGVEDYVGGAVPPAVLESVAESSVLQLAEPIGGDRRTPAVASEALQAFSVPSRDRNVCVQAEARRIRTTRWWRGFQIIEIFGINTISQAQ
jgi:hypothetical protein